MQTPLKRSRANDENHTPAGIKFISYSGTVSKVKRARTVLQPLTPQTIAEGRMAWLKKRGDNEKLAQEVKLAEETRVEHEQQQESTRRLDSKFCILGPKTTSPETDAMYLIDAEGT